MSLIDGDTASKKCRDALHFIVMSVPLQKCPRSGYIETNTFQP